MNHLSHKKNKQLLRNDEKTETKPRKIQDEFRPVKTPPTEPEIVTKSGKPQRLGNILFMIIFSLITVVCLLIFSYQKISNYINPINLKIFLLILVVGLTLTFFFSKE